jgi:hypothetical protein
VRRRTTEPQCAEVAHRIHGSRSVLATGLPRYAPCRGRLRGRDPCRPRSRRRRRGRLRPGAAVVRVHGHRRAGRQRARGRHRHQRRHGVRDHRHAPGRAAAGDGVRDRLSRARIVWRDCGTPLQCARVDVPMDWSAPAGPRISLPVVRYPASGIAGQCARRRPCPRKEPQQSSLRTPAINARPLAVAAHDDSP